MLKRVKKNTESNLVTTFRYAYETARGGEVKSVVRALEVIQSLDGLGVAFASKHLKFLVPSSAVVLDSVIESKLGYATNSAG